MENLSGILLSYKDAVVDSDVGGSLLTEELEILSLHFEEISEGVYFFDVPYFRISTDGKSLRNIEEVDYDDAPAGLLRLMTPMIDKASEEVAYKIENEDGYLEGLRRKKVFAYLNDSFSPGNLDLKPGLFVDLLAFGAHRSDDGIEEGEEDLSGGWEIEDPSQEAQEELEEEEVESEEELDGEEVEEEEGLSDDEEKDEEKIEVIDDESSEELDDEVEGGGGEEEGEEEDLSGGGEIEGPSQEELDQEEEDELEEGDVELEEELPSDEVGGDGAEEGGEEEFSSDGAEEGGQEEEEYKESDGEVEEVVTEFKLVESEVLEMEEYIAVDLNFSMPLDRTALTLQSFEFEYEGEVYGPEFIYLASKEVVLFFESVEGLNLNLLKFSAIKAELDESDVDDSELDMDLELDGIVTVADTDDEYINETQVVENSYEAYVGKDIVFRMSKISFGEMSGALGDDSTIELSIGNANLMDDRCAILAFGEDLKRIEDENGVEKVYDYRLDENHIDSSGLSLVTQSSGGVPVDQRVIERFENENDKGFLGFAYFGDLEVRDGQKLLYLRLSVDGGKEKGRYTSDLSVELFCPKGA